MRRSRSRRSQDHFLSLTRCVLVVVIVSTMQVDAKAGQRQWHISTPVISVSTGVSTRKIFCQHRIAALGFLGTDTAELRREPRRRKPSSQRIFLGLRPEPDRYFGDACLYLWRSWLRKRAETDRKRIEASERVRDVSARVTKGEERRRYHCPPYGLSVSTILENSRLKSRIDKSQILGHLPYFYILHRRWHRSAESWSR